MAPPVLNIYTKTSNKGHTHTQTPLIAKFHKEAWDTYQRSFYTKLNIQKLMKSLELHSDVFFMNF